MKKRMTLIAAALLGLASCARGEGAPLAASLSPSPSASLFIPFSPAPTIDINDAKVYEDFIWEANETLNSMFDNRFSDVVIGKIVESDGSTVDIVEYLGPNRSLSELRATMDQYYSYNVLVSELNNMYFAVGGDRIGEIAATGENRYSLEVLPEYTSTVSLQSVTGDRAAVHVTRFNSALDEMIFEYIFDIRDPSHMQIINIDNEEQPYADPYLTEIVTIPVD